MECERCKQRTATVHMTQIINNQKKTMNLCEHCARDMQMGGFGFMPQFDLHKLMAGLFHNQGINPPTTQEAQQDIPEGIKCPNCSLSERKFAQQGLLGCSHCYEVFGDKLDPLFRRIHGNNVHTGKVPERTGGRVKILYEINRLKSHLKEAIHKEEFEAAAELRDAIKELETKLAGEESQFVD